MSRSESVGGVAITEQNSEHPKLGRIILLFGETDVTSLNDNSQSLTELPNPSTGSSSRPVFQSGS